MENTKRVNENEMNELLFLVSSFIESMKTTNEVQKEDVILSFLKDINSLQITMKKDLLKEDNYAHSALLQGISLPMVVNSICDEYGNWKTSDCSIRIGTIDGEEKIIITPNIISIP